MVSSDKVSDSARISPTAHYTAYVWARHGLSYPELATPQGRLMHLALRPANQLLAAVGQADLESMLLARHRLIDHLLEQAIEEGRVSQVVEIAAGLSPRGLRMCERFDHLHYVEGDLFAMAANKRLLIRKRLSPRHRVVELDALATEGANSLSTMVDALDPSQGVAVITEGLLPYFSRAKQDVIWRNISDFLGDFPSSLYLADHYLRGDSESIWGVKTFARLLSWFAKGTVHMPYDQEHELAEALEDCGFDDVNVHRAGDYAGTLPVAGPRQSAYVRIIEACTDRS